MKRASAPPRSPAIRTVDPVDLVRKCEVLVGQLAV